jgi:chemotaxis protein methyltransferase CheR
VPHATESCEPFLEWLLQRSSLDAAAYRPRALHRRLAACLRHCRVSTPEAARALLEAKPDMIPSTLNSVLIGVSAFFRDPRIFRFLRDVVLPELLPTRGRIRVYSAGASEGQELISAALLLAEAGTLARSELLGVDCRAGAIEHARAAIFAPDALTGIDANLRGKYFCPVGGKWVLAPEVKQTLHWRVADLISFREESPWDLIFFRNVAIYLHDQHATKAWGNLCQQLRPGGFLITGTAETPPKELPLTRVGTAVYRKTT